MSFAQRDTAWRTDGRSSLAAALSRGGVGNRINRRELRALLRGVADAQAVTGTAGSGPRLASPGGLDDAAVHGTVAVLCPGRPVVLPGIEPTLRLVFLSEPIEAGAEGASVDALFLILSPSAAAHDAILSVLADLLDDRSFLALLADHPPAESLIRFITRGEVPEAAAAT